MTTQAVPTRTGPRKGLLPSEVTVDPYDDRTYLRFVATAAVDLLGDHLGKRTRSQIAKEAFTPSMEPSNLSSQLARPGGPSPEFLSRVERQYLCRKVPLHNGAPWLTSFHDELQLHHQTTLEQRQDTRTTARKSRTRGDLAGTGTHEPVRIPIGWFYNLAQHPPRTSTEAFVQGHALRAFLSDARQATQAMRANAKRARGQEPSDGATGAAVEDLLDGFGLRNKAETTVSNLLEVVAGPPHTGLPAVRLVASLGELPLGQVEAFILDGGHVAGFRAVRVLGRILSGRGGADADLVRRVEPILRRIYEKEPPDPYPARSLLIEALRYTTKAPADEPWGWVTKALVTRTQREDRPTRERVYAAYVLFARGDFQEATQAMEYFRTCDEEGEGLNYAAAFLDMMFKRMDPAAPRPYPWPHERRECSIVDGATKILDSDPAVPYSVRGALRTMVQGALLTIDGTARRRICEAIQAAGLASRAVAGLSAVIQGGSSPPWLREHAAFIIGYLQTGYPVGAGQAIAVLASLALDSTQLPAVRHAALWGTGDIVGSVEQIDELEQEWRETGEGLPKVHSASRLHGELLVKLVDQCSTVAEDGRPEPEVRHAAAYAAAMLARRCAFSRRKPHTAVSRVLTRLEDDNDALVRGFGSWGRKIEAARSDDSYLARAEPEGPPLLPSAP